MTFLFDLDDTLVNTSEIVFQSMQEWCALHHLDVNVAIATGKGRRTVETVALLAPGLNVKREAKWIEDREVQLVENIQPMDGAVEFVSSLQESNWAVVTSSSHELALRKLLACHFPMPKVLVSADNVLCGKPSPEPYVKAMELLGVSPSECFAFEDSESGLISAIEAGCKVVVVGTYTGKYRSDIHAQINSFKQLHLSESGIMIIGTSNTSL